jgi:hypothetical protein
MTAGARHKRSIRKTLVLNFNIDRPPETPDDRAPGAESLQDRPVGENGQTICAARA